jgi:Outer membrane protein and related peptidoglycan-associated (lipo)proteins
MKRSTSIILSVVVLSLMASSVFAQRAIRQSETSSKPKSFFEAGFWDNWFVSATGGVNHYFGEDDNYNPDGFFGAITPNIKLSVGKWLRPSYGLRLQTEGMWLKGWNDGLNYEGVYTWNKLINDGSQGSDPVLNFNPPKDKDGKGYYQRMRYMDLHLDFMINLINLWKEYDVNRPLDVYFYAGVGWAHMFEHKGIPTDNEIIGKLGTVLNIKLTDRLSGNIELQNTLVNEAFDGQIGGRGISNHNRTYEGYASLTAGFSYRLQNTFTKYDYVDPEVVKELNAKANDALADNKRLQERLDEFCPKDSCDKLRQQLQDALSKKCKERLYVVIQYVIDKWNVRSSEMYKLEEIVDFMKKHPEVNISVTGYADIKTANPTYNQKLSEKRANEVIRMLTTKFKVSKDRIKSKGLGDSIQPFKENERNRAVIALDLDE